MSIRDVYLRAELPGADRSWFNPCNIRRRNEGRQRLTIEGRRVIGHRKESGGVKYIPGIRAAAKGAFRPYDRVRRTRLLNAWHRETRAVPCR